MVSNTKIKLRMKKKTNPDLIGVISTSLKNPKWKKITEKLSSSTKNLLSINLDEVDSNSSEGDTLIVVGKILSRGKLTKKIKLCTLAISGFAKEKLKESNSEFVYLEEEIKKNPNAEGIKIIK